MNLDKKCKQCILIKDILNSLGMKINVIKYEDMHENALE